MPACFSRIRKGGAYPPQFSSFIGYPNSNNNSAAGILAGIPNYFSSWFLLKALVRLPAMLVYPVFSVGSILLVTGFGALIFKERLEKRQWLGLGLILIALILLNL